MIIKASDLMAMPYFTNYTADFLKSKMDAIEDTIRAYTNNKFHVRGVWTPCVVSEGKITGDMSLFAVGDTIEITDSPINDGLYTISAISGSTATLDASLRADGNASAYLVKYPKAVVSGSIELLRYDVSMRQKTMIKSESLSRHSVTYYDRDADSETMGYPRSLMGFLAPYRKIRC